MKNFPIMTTPLESTPKAADNLIRTWKIDQILKLRAETSSNSTGQLIARIGNLKVTASTPVLIKAGETFSVQVQSLGQVPLLKIVSTLAGPERAVMQFLRESLPKQDNFEPLMQRLLAITKIENSLPRPVSTLMQSIANNLPTLDKMITPVAIKTAITSSGTFLESKLANPNTSKIALLSDLKAQLLKLRTVISKQLVDPYSVTGDKLPSASSRSPNGMRAAQSPFEVRPGTAPLLQQAVNLFIEGKILLPQLAKSITLNLPGDQLGILMSQLDAKEPLLKRPGELSEPLLKLMQAIQLQPSPTRTIESLLAQLRNIITLQELQQLTESALNRIQTTQLTSIARDTGNNFFLFVDQPIQREDEVHNTQIQFEKDQSEDESAEQWTVTMNFNLPELGPIQARLKLQENHLVTRFEADRHETVADIRDHLPKLHEALTKIGLSIEHLSVEHGKTDSTIRPTDTHHLLDEIV